MDSLKDELILLFKTRKDMLKEKIQEGINYLRKYDDIGQNKNRNSKKKTNLD